MNIKNIIIAGILLLLSMNFATLTSAVESCGGTCPGGIGDGDAALGINFTGLQPSDLSTGSFVVGASNSGRFSCDYGGGTAGNSSSCTASYNSSNNNIECLIKHLDCRNGAFNISVNAPTGYSCSASPSSTSLANCSNNTPITVNCTTPAPVCESDGSCSAPTPACGQTTNGTDNCGNPCSRTGPACPVDGSVCTAISVNSGNAVTSGQTYSATVSMKNPAGNFTTWTTAADYKLGSSNPRDNTVWGLSRVALPSTTTPGNTATFNFDITAPSVTAQSTKPFYWEMLREGVDWFGAQCQHNVTVKPPATQITLACVATDLSGNTITSANTGQPVTWKATIVGGTSPFSYSWSGTDSLSSSTSSSTSRTNTTTKTYSTAGSKSATIAVTDSDSTNNPDPSKTCSVTITAPFDYNISNTGSITVKQGSSDSTTINLTKLAGTAQSVTLSSNPSLPSGASKQMSVSSCTSYPCSSTYTISTSSTTPTGTYPVTVTGSSSGLADKSTSFNLIVQAATSSNPPPTVDLKVNSSNGPITLTNNSSATLSWTTTQNPTTCTASGSWSGSKSASGSSQSTGTLTGPASYTYTLACSNTNGSNSDTVVVNVLAPGGSGPFCGDGVCNGTESTATCSQDCPSLPSTSNCPWIQTTGGDVHSNTGINTPCGP